MIYVSSLLLLAMQVGPNPQAIPPSDGHAELRDRQPRNRDAGDVADPSSAWLASCLDRLSEDASRAHTMAQLRRIETSGADRVLANHCLGLAATELGRWSEAADAFEAARTETPSDEPRARARFGMMTGNAYLAAGEAEQASHQFLRARSDANTAASATLEAMASIDLARAYVRISRPEEALVELAHATRIVPDNSEGWLLTATLLRRLERFDEAQSAIETAGELAPLNPDIGLEAGVIAVLTGREDAARSSWQSVLNIQPDSLAAQVAREYLAQLGVPTASPTLDAEAVPQEPS